MQTTAVPARGGDAANAAHGGTAANAARATVGNAASSAVGGAVGGAAGRAALSSGAAGAALGAREGCSVPLELPLSEGGVHAGGGVARVQLGLGFGLKLGLVWRQQESKEP